MTRSLRRCWVRCSSSNLSQQTLASMLCDHVTRQTCAKGTPTSLMSPKISWISQGENKETQILQCSTYKRTKAEAAETNNFIWLEIWMFFSVLRHVKAKSKNSEESDDSDVDDLDDEEISLGSMDEEDFGEELEEEGGMFMDPDDDDDDDEGQLG